MAPPLWAESEEELKSLLIKVKVESEKVGLKLNIQKSKIMASGPISSVQFSHSVMSDSLRPHHFMANRWGNTGETVSDFDFWAPKSLQIVIAAMKLKDAYSRKESYDQPR